MLPNRSPLLEVQPMRPPRLFSIAVILLTLAAVPAPAAEKPKTGGNDLVWESPDLARYPATSIAMLPVVMFNDNAEQRKLIESAVGQALKTSGHRWVSPFIVRDNLIRAGGDSLMKALNAKVLAAPRLDSLDAPYISRALRARALLTVRADQMEQMELEMNQSGRPSTTVYLKAALVDSTGRLLWTVSSNETLEGQRQEAGGNIIGVKASGLNNTPIGLSTAAPPYPEVLSKIAQRWALVFPQRAKPDSARTSP
jgi:hypothetical protein